MGTGVQVGDVVVAQHFVQHDMDVRPLFPRWQVPGYPHPTFHCHPTLTERLHKAALDCTRTAAQWNEPLLQGRSPAVHAGLIASGDQFIVSANLSQTMHGDFQAAGLHALAVEMEGAAIAQVCADYGIAFAAVRTIFRPCRRCRARRLSGLRQRSGQPLRPAHRCAVSQQRARVKTAATLVADHGFSLRDSCGEDSLTNSYNG